MPYAVADQDGERFDLKSLEGAYVVLRRHNYGAKLRRLEASSKMTLAMGKGRETTEGQLDMLQFNATLFDFQRCIVEHNLFKDRDETVPFNFTQPGDFAALDPRVGEEIAKILDKMNNFEDDAELGKSEA